MRYALSILILLSAALTLSIVTGQEEKKQPDDFWMKKKLEYAQNVLHGITMEDFDMVQKNAASMRQLNAIESFLRRKDTKAYRAQLAIFEFATDELAQNAKEKDIDGATSAFTQLTLSCVNCHKHLRAAP